jgi:ubiquinone biosynthesis protein UbiJ
MLAQTAALALNHLLGQQAWARERMIAHAGQTVEFRSPPLPALQFRIDESGRITAAASPGADLVVVVRPAALAYFLRRDPAGAPVPQSFDGAFHFIGPVDLADTVRELLQRLDWDAEEDLSRVVGDVAAHRIAEAARGMAAWRREASGRLAQNVAEYVGEERQWVLTRPLFESMSAELAALIDALARLEQRVERASPRDGAHGPR